MEYFNSFKNHIPFLSTPVAITILIINCLLPGVGTLCFIFLSNYSHWKEHLLIGISQLLTTVFIVGWVWSICWGVFAVLKSKNWYTI